MGNMEKSQLKNVGTFNGPRDKIYVANLPLACTCLRANQEI